MDVIFKKKMLRCTVTSINKVYEKVSIFPDDQKQGNIAPIHKMNNKQPVKPIRLLKCCFVCFCEESIKILCKTLLDHVYSNDKKYRS